MGAGTVSTCWVFWWSHFRTRTPTAFPSPASAELSLPPQHFMGHVFRVAEVDICSSLDLLLKVSCFNLVCLPKCGLHWWSRRCFLEIKSTKNVGSFTKRQSLLTCVEHLVIPTVASGWVRGGLDSCRFLRRNPLPCPASDVGSGQLVFGMLVMELVALCHSCQKSCTWSGHGLHTLPVGPLGLCALSPGPRGCPWPTPTYQRNTELSPSTLLQGWALPTGRAWHLHLGHVRRLGNVLVGGMWGQGMLRLGQ